MFWAVDDVPEKEVMDLWKQMSSKWSFTCICGIFCPVNLSPTIIQFILDLHFAPSLMRFTLSLQSVFSLSLNFTASLQSAVHSLYFTLTALVSNDSNGLSVKLQKAIKAWHQRTWHTSVTSTCMCQPLMYHKIKGNKTLNVWQVLNNGLVWWFNILICTQEIVTPTEDLESHWPGWSCCCQYNKRKSCHFVKSKTGLCHCHKLLLFFCKFLSAVGFLEQDCPYIFCNYFGAMSLVTNLIIKMKHMV